jgi:nudix-type nucleoside diphosphatase (YffH/AdpP family)
MSTFLSPRGVICLAIASARIWRQSKRGSRVLMEPTILGRKIVYSGYLTVERLRIRLLDGAIVSREIERHGDADAVLPYDMERRCALVAHLFRAPVFSETGAEMLEEACAGMIERESDESAARREACEELGVRLRALELVTRVWSSPGVSAERQSLFLASYVPADRIGVGGGVIGEHEGITVVERPVLQIFRDIENGHVVDGKLATLIFALRLRRPGLFH